MSARRVAPVIFALALLTAACGGGLAIPIQSVPVGIEQITDLPDEMRVADMVVAAGHLWILGFQPTGREREEETASLSRLELRALESATRAARTAGRRTFALGTSHAWKPYWATGWSNRLFFEHRAALAVGDDALWVAHAGGLWRVPLSGEAPALTIPEPTMAVAVGEGAVWAVSPKAIHRIDPGTARMVATISIPGSPPRWIAAGGGAVWVARDWTHPEHTLFGSDDRGDLLRIDPETQTITETIPLEWPRGLAFGHGALWVWRGLQDRMVDRLDPQTNRVVASIVLCRRGLDPWRCDSSEDRKPWPVKVTPDAVWVGEVRLDPRTNTARWISLKTGYWFWSRAVEASDGVVWVSAVPWAGNPTYFRPRLMRTRMP
jgi:hypothetical protein